MNIPVHCICYMIKFSNNFSIFTPMWTYARRNALRGKRYCLFLFFLFFQLFWWQHSRDGVVSQKNLTFHITFHVYWKTHSPWNNKMQKKRKFIIFFLPTYYVQTFLFYIKLWIVWKLDFSLSYGEVIPDTYLLIFLGKKICLGNTYMLYVVLQ